MRRADREIKNFDDIVSIIKKCSIVRLAMCDKNKPYIVPMNFGFDAIDGNLTLYLHCAPKGKRLEMLEANQNICFEMDCSYKTIPGQSAQEWTAQYESVIGEGTVSMVQYLTAKTHAFKQLMAKYGYRKELNLPQSMLQNTTVLRIDVSKVTGKRNMPM